jgi:hypothetical protein
MKSIIRVVSIVVGMGVIFPNNAWADKRSDQLAEVAAIKEQLKPLRQQAYLEPEVIDARKQLDVAYKAYWDAVRAAMLRLDPGKKDLIDKEIALRKEVAPISAGSRASSYEKKAGEKPSKKPAP